MQPERKNFEAGYLCCVIFREYSCFLRMHNEAIVFEEMLSMSLSNAPRRDGRLTLVRVQEKKKKEKNASSRFIQKSKFSCLIIH